MVMKVEPVARCLRQVRREAGPNTRSILMSAAGRPFDQQVAMELARESEVILVCGHYEGVDERVSEFWVDQELSIGDYVLSGGELPALVVIDAVARLLPGVLGNLDSLTEESHQSGILEYPQYTRPSEFEGASVPEVLLSGNHAEIARFRRTRALEKTRVNRPDLFSRLESDEIQKDAVLRLGRPPEDE